MNINLDNLSFNSLKSVIQDFGNRISNLEDEKGHLKDQVSAEVCGRESAIQNLSNYISNLENEKNDLLKEDCLSPRHALIKQLCKIAQSIDPHGSLAIFGAISEVGFRATAIEAYHQKNEAGLKESEDTIDNWRNVLVPPF